MARIPAALVLACDLAADAGFDPAGLATSKVDLYNYREAENGGRDPSVLNGGLGLISPVYWVGVVALAGAIEFVGETNKARQKAEDSTWMLTGSWVPGDLGFDPLGLYTTFGDNAQAKMLMETAELKNGRLAMVAIPVIEVVSGKP
ncbi:chlorophyll A-B binding protein [Aureococcus anophagefferens]|nr:chlorophyll A-B binding protein [Aureococcus anophagefferens]